MGENKDKIRNAIRKNYAEVALKGTANGGCCCSSGCCCGDSVVDVKEESLRIGYKEKELNGVPIESNMGLGCGNPLALASRERWFSILEAEEALIVFWQGGLWEKVVM